MSITFNPKILISGLAQTQYTFSTIDVPHAKATQINANTNTTVGELIAGQFDDASGTTHGFVLKNRVFPKIDAPLSLASGVVPGVVVLQSMESTRLASSWRLTSKKTTLALRNRYRRRTPFSKTMAIS